MRGLFRLFFILLILFAVSKIINLALTGRLFQRGAFRESVKESLKTLWQGMQLFVIVWFLYLIFLWWVRRR
ncbi:MAG: hypothetical protein ONB24_08980 [candidate division KSB1 bacterium]|nr:hypothetical protein [candidate division KSB1 bacterium]